jgi:predicted ATPase
MLQGILADQVVEMNTYPHFGDLLYQQLARIDRTPAWLAKRLGVNGGTVSRWLNDGARPGSPETIVRVADILGISSQVGRLLTAAGYGYQAAAQEGEAAPKDLEVFPPDPVARHNLPMPTTPFVGRQAEVEELLRLFGDPAVRLLTILAPGGMGKTRLALEVAARQCGKYRHGVYFVPPLAQGEADDLPVFIAAAVSYQLQSDARSPKQQLFDYLHGKEILLVLDSFEHLLPAAEFLHELLQTAPHIRLLVTSRERLKLSSETVFRLDGMDTPAQDVETAAGSSAAQLFLQGAARLRPAYMPTSEDWPAITKICRITQGMPLAILLAAAWIETLSPQEIAEEIGASIDFLAADLRDLPAYQRSISAILTQTWEQLTDSERAVLPFLSLFRGGFTRQAAQVVSGASLATLSALTDKALLWRDASGRYAIHELLGQYAEERLVASGCAGAARDAHCVYYMTLLSDNQARLKGQWQVAVFEELDRERENIHAAWRYALEQAQVSRLAQAMGVLFRYYEVRGYYHEGDLACQAMAALLTSSMQSVEPAQNSASSQNSNDEYQLLARLLTWRSAFNRRQGRAEIARQFCQQSLALLDRLSEDGQDTRADRAAALLLMGDLMWYADVEAAHGFLQESLALCRSTGDQWATAAVLRELGRVAFVSGLYEEAQRYAQESVTLRRNIDDQMGLPSSLALLNWVASAQGHLEQAERYAQEHYRTSRQSGNRTMLAQSFFNLGIPLLHNGRFADALATFEKSWTITQKLGDRHHLNSLNMSRSRARLHLGQYAEAGDLAQLALLTADEMGLISHRGGALTRLAEVRIVEGAYQEAEELLIESSAIFEEIGQPFHMVPVYSAYGYIAYHTGNFTLAQRSLSQLRHFAVEKHDFYAATYLPPLAAMLVSAHQKGSQSLERSLALYSAALRSPFVANSRWYADVAGHLITAKTTTLPHDIAQAARQRGRKWKIEEIIADIEQLVGHS